MSNPERLIVHIGPGKTATTTFQRHVFPQLAEMAGYSYNPEQIKKYGMRQIWSPGLKEERKIFEEQKSRYPSLFISFEGFSGWQPDLYEEFADKNLRLWGEDATIMLTLRDPVDYQTSVYCQFFRMGLRWRPEDFFLNKREYDFLRSFSGTSLISHFSVDDFDQRKFVQAYKDRFKKVVAIPFKSQFEMWSLADVFGLTEQQRLRLVKELKDSPKENSGDTALEMDLLYFFWSLLGKIGKDEMTTRAQEWKLREIRYGQRVQKKFADLSISEKLNILPQKLKNKVLNPRLAARAIQASLAPFVPAKKFTLPDSVYQNEELVVANREFIAQLVADEYETIVRPRAK